MEELVLKGFFVCLIISILTMGSCFMHQDYRISQAIKQGADPIAAHIAFSSSQYNTVEKVLYIAKDKKE